MTSLGQIAAFKILQEMGGKCTTAQFKERIFKNLPPDDNLLHSYKQSLRRLRMWEYVTYDYPTDTWTLIPGAKMVYTSYPKQKSPQTGTA